MGNAFSLLALVGWPVVCLIAFARFKPQVAVLIAFMGAMLFLPEKVDIKAPFQPLGKQEFAAIGALLGVLLVGAARRRLFTAKIFTAAELWIFVLMLGSFGTSRTNMEGLSYGVANLPGLTDWEAVSVGIGDVYTYLIPFVLARALFNTREDAMTLLRGFHVAALCYVPFIMIEILMSPQMHNWVYGFAQHDFIQTMRGGGYRPMVFMGHGLGLTLFLAAAVLAGITLTLARKPTILRIRGRHMSIFLLIVLLGCKSLGAAVFALLFTVVLHLLAPKGQLRVLVLFAAVIVAYPVSRATEVFPHAEITQFIKDTAGPDRAQSIEFRFTNEAALTEHGAKKPIFGWGRFRRSMLFTPWKDEPVSVADGYWIGTYGARGAVGFICTFGLLLTPMFFLRSKIKKLTNADDRYLLVGLACMLMLYTVDLIPNGLFTNFPFFFAGAVLGLVRGITSTPTVGPIEISMQAPGQMAGAPSSFVNVPPVAPKVATQT
ncbi:MAG: hypothetical protein Q8O67_02120 [Deltaproteobacteria bacterium]|nr:hypothetical protein [Deltaproteobacteria bacterium]